MGSNVARDFRPDSSISQGVGKFPSGVYLRVGDGISLAGNPRLRRLELSTVSWRDGGSRESLTVPGGPLI